MDSAKNIMEVWIDTQSKMVDNWMEATKKIQTAAGEGELLNKGVELYKQWFESQKELMNKAVEKATGTPAATPDMLQEFMKQQKAFTQKWEEMMSSMVKKAPYTPETYMKEAQNMYEKWVEITQQTWGKLGINTDFAQFVPGKFSKESMENFIKTSRTYLNVMEFWKPYYSLATEQNTRWEDFNKLMNPEKYQQLVQEMFGMLSPEKMQNFFDQYTNYFNTFIGKMRDANIPFKDMYGQFGKLMPSFMQQDFETYNQFQQKWNEQVQKAYEPAMKMMAPGKQKELIELSQHLNNAINTYRIKYAELQFIIMNTVRKSTEATVQRLMDDLKAGQPVKTYNEFFMTWVNDMEHKLIDLFNGEHFSKVQADLLNTSMDIKSALEQNIEFAFSPLPLAVRSDMDALTKQVHDLKSRLRSLEKKVSNSTQEEEIAGTEEESETTPKKVSTRKK